MEEEPDPDSDSAQEEDEDRRGDDLAKEDEVAEQQLADAGVDMDSIFLEGAGTGDNWGRVPQTRIMAELAAKRDAEIHRREAEEVRLPP